MSVDVRRIAAIAILIAILALTYVGLVGPVIGLHRNLDNEISESRDHIARFAVGLGREEETETRLADLHRQLAAGGLHIDGASHAIAAAELQNMVRTVIADSGGIVQSIQILPPDTTGPIERIPLRVELTATTEDLVGILYRVEGAKPYLFVDDIEIQGRPPVQHGRNEPAESALVIRFEVSAYLRPSLP